ncbi:MAG: integral rane sensor signal transduction histidine kinase [Acidimicrobiales bacterium]|nr:integral rane sensor signal transduction histidine kinase [Acidimicrobiales bacterium]
MTLRSRLVVALVLLSTAGLAVFGVATYVLYARSQYERLDAQIRTAEPFARAQLRAETIPGRPGPGRVGPPPVVVPIGTYVEERTPDGLVQRLQAGDSSTQPNLPADLGTVTPQGRYLTVGSTTGSGRWRVLVSEGPGGSTVIVAFPLTEVTEALRRLVAIEGVSAGVLLALLGAGSWFILRRGLHPLEAMATTARSITAGDLSQRVEPSESKTEVGQLGLALNTMLGEIEEAFREREATELRLRQFLADASHELRTPLTSIQGFAELYRLGGDQEHVDQPTIFRRIEEESARMKTLVEDLLLLARLDQTRPAERVPVDLAVLAADACSDAVAAAPDRPVSLVAPDPVVVRGDGDHLRQAIGNLVANALRHTPAGTPLEVSATLEGGAAVVRVRDHGRGLGEEALEHAFDRFWQADEARVGNGAGLGLSIVAGIAREHGGTATAANAPDGGAVFTLTLPMTSEGSPQGR